MAYEIHAWKTPDCSLSVEVARLSQHETSSREINETHGEDGALNANYRTVEAAIKAATILGKIDLVYGVDFIWKTAGYGVVSFDFKDRGTRARAGLALAFTGKKTA